MSMDMSEDSKHPESRSTVADPGAPGPDLHEAAAPCGDNTAAPEPEAGPASGSGSESEPESLSAGAMLAQARARCSLSLGEVANHLKLSIRQVEALESDAFDRLPSPMFIRGFARSYARLVKVDPVPVMRALDQHLPLQPAIAAVTAPVRSSATRQPPPSAIPFPSPDQPSRRLHSVAALLAAVVVGFLAFEWFGPVGVVGAPGQGAGDRAPAVAVPLQPGVSAAEPATAGAAVPDGTAPVPAGALPAVPQAPVGASSSAPSDIDAAFGTAPRSVRLSFDRESWVEIRDARGRLIFSQLNPPGSSQVVQGEPPLSLVVGNARSVRLAYGDRDIDLAPHTRVDVARFTLD